MKDNSIMGVAIVGCGTISETHARAVSNIEEAEIIAVSSRNGVRARELAYRYQCLSYTDYNKMLENDSIDLVIVCTPSGFHAEYGIAAAKKGKHVMVEKPIDISLSSANALKKVS